MENHNIKAIVCCLKPYTRHTSIHVLQLYITTVRNVCEKNNKNTHLCRHLKSLLLYKFWHTDQTIYCDTYCNMIYHHILWYGSRQQYPFLMITWRTYVNVFALQNALHLCVWHLCYAVAVKERQWLNLLLRRNVKQHKLFGDVLCIYR